jgi:hypothetical protein
MTTTNTHTHLLRCVTILVGAGALASGCQLEKMFPGDVGAGAARLTVRNAAILTKLLSDDTGCGFASEAVRANATIEGDVGSIGRVTFTASDCVLDLGSADGKGHDVGADCNDVERHAFGKVTVDGTKVVEGVITGNAESPVIPLTADAATISWQAQVENFKVVLSSADNDLVMQSGTVSLTSEIHLAVNDAGICSIDTAEVTMQALQVTDAVFTINNNGSVFDVEVPSMSVQAQLGAWGDRENFIGGTVRVWDQDVDLDDNHVLDEAYDADEFQASYACREGMVTPQSYTCPDLTETVADGAARLLLNDVGNLVSAAVANTTCGFASSTVLNSARVTGAVGYDGGDVVYTIASPCEIELPEDTVLSTDCHGTPTVASGRALMTGSMRQRGRVTGDPSQPIIPTSRDAVEITFNITFDGWAVQSGIKTFRVDTGGVSGTMKPRLAKDTSTGACSIATPVVTFESLLIAPGTSGLVIKEGKAMGVTFRSGELNAQVGTKDGDENRLTGEVIVDVLGQSNVSVDVSGQLDPDFDALHAVDAFSCIEHLELPADDDACSFDEVIGQNSARLVIQSVGTLASMINSDDNCGFEDTLGVLVFPTTVVGDTGEMGSITWDVADCAISHDLTALSQDCLGGTTWVEGDATYVDVGRTVRGERDSEFLVVDSIIPRDRNSVDLNLRTVQLHEFAAYAVPAGADEPAGMLVIHDGTLSATVQPATANRADDPATFDIPTPTARLSSVRLTGAASLYAQGKTFHFTITDANLNATNGAFLGTQNALSGTIGIDGRTLNLGQLALNPAYDASTFEDSYACIENLGPNH